MTQPLLRVQDLTTRLATPRGMLQLVNNISFEVARGETLALVGESGSGKSLTALSVMGLLPAHARHPLTSKIMLDDINLLTLSEAQRQQIRGKKIGMIFQEPMTSLNPVLTIGDQIGEVLYRHQGLRGQALKKRVIALLEAVHIPLAAQRANDYPHQLSGGMKQRVMIAMAIACEPDLLIADEPTTALDVTIQAEILKLLTELQRQSGMGLLLITHDLAVVAQVADTVAVMTQGKLVEQNTTAAFFAGPTHPYSQKLLAALPAFARESTSLVSKYPDLKAEKSPAADADKPLLDVRNLQVYFPIKTGFLRRAKSHLKAVDDVSLHIEAGKTLALVGESGSGKTTLGRSISQLIPATSGEVYFNGAAIHRLKSKALREYRRDIQFIFQDPFSAMNPRMMIQDLLEEGMLALHIEPEQRKRRARLYALLEYISLPRNSLSRYPHEFSGGERQRLCIARALAVNPKLIICDEPTSALDVTIQAQILDLLKDLQNELNLTYLFITHNLSIVPALAHEVAVMHLGKIVEQGATQQIFEQPQAAYTKSLLAAAPKLV